MVCSLRGTTVSELCRDSELPSEAAFVSERSCVQRAARRREAAALRFSLLEPPLPWPLVEPLWPQLKQGIKELNTIGPIGSYRLFRAYHLRKPFETPPPLADPLLPLLKAWPLLEPPLPLALPVPVLPPVPDSRSPIFTEALMAGSFCTSSSFALKDNQQNCCVEAPRCGRSGNGCRACSGRTAQSRTSSS